LSKKILENFFFGEGRLENCWRYFFFRIYTRLKSSIKL